MLTSCEHESSAKGLDHTLYWATGNVMRCSLVWIGDTNNCLDRFMKCAVN